MLFEQKQVNKTHVLALFSNREHAVLMLKMGEEYFPQIPYIRETLLSGQEVGESRTRASLFFFFPLPISNFH